jgi:chromosomal replication initiation ATPase DnaA
MMGLPDTEPRQLAFELDPRENFSRDDFLRGPGNAAALDLILSWPNWPVRVVALIGPEGSGKSHLAAIWAAAASARRLASGALDEAAVPAALAAGALAIERAGSDDLRDVDERAMFHLLNLAREQRAFVLLTARTAPAGWSIALPDLASRLRALPVVTLAAPDDAMLRAVLVKLFADRQLAVDDGLIGYLMVRIERSFAAARRVVAALDREALRRQRPVTRALAGEILDSAFP